LRYFVAVEAADHFYNAARVVASGAGRPITHADVTPASVSGEIDLLLEDERYRDVAAAIAAEIAAMPPARDALPALTALADQGQSERGKA